ncbi:ABC transporter substrate-binding protein [Streptomyces sp. NBC_01506]|uniref:ABC transporter substrate-binding protein n=1 Tax=Streptomyces sp. NBC_01506 TaxID=2903887 RepID=UPI00386D7009
MRTRSRIAACAVSAVLLLSGCSGGGDSSDGRITLRFQSLAWQDESVAVNKELVKEWNAAHPDVRVEYVQGSWDSVHDQLLTSFEGGEAPDIIHDASDDLADFAYGGSLADLDGLLPDRLKRDIPERSWQTTTFGDGVYGVPFLQEPRVLIANKKILEASGVRIPTAENPWTWAEFRAVSKELTAGEGQKPGPGQAEYGVAWPLKDPVSATLNLSRSTGGQLFHRGADDKVTIQYTEADAEVPAVIHDQVNSDGSASGATLGMGGSDTLPGFFGGTYAMVPLGFSYRQQIIQQAPKDFEWTVLPAPAGADGATQGVSPQTLSVSEDTRHKEEAVAFIDFLLQPQNMVRLARGDWMLPTGTAALTDPSLHTEKDGWGTGAALARDLLPAPAQTVRGYPEWKDKVATPALQEYYSGAIDRAELEKRLVKDGNLVLARYQR